MIHYSDDLEKKIGDKLTACGIEFTHGSAKGLQQRLDFFLPKYNVYIEVKKYHTERINSQMASQDNVIAIQGVGAVDFFIKLLNLKNG